MSSDWMAPVETLPCKVLVVEDDPLQRELLFHASKGEGRQVFTAGTLSEAKRILTEEGEGISTVILDWHLPDGMASELLALIAQKSAVRRIPVIMQTGKPSREIFEAGVRAGVFHFLYKPFDLAMVEWILGAALNDWRHGARISASSKAERFCWGLLQEAVFSFRDFKQAEDLSYFLAAEVPVAQQSMLQVATKEILWNAVEHGNLGLRYEDKSRFLQEGAYAEEIQRRLLHPDFKDRRARMRVIRTERTLEVSIEDDGEGFDAKPYLVMDPARASDLHGLGIALARLIIEDLRYEGKGNLCRFTIRTALPS